MIYQFPTKYLEDKHQALLHEKGIQKQTIWAQIVLANRKRQNPSDQSSFLPNDIHRMQQYLRKTSASEFPPALSAMYGLGTRPHRLYKSIGIDRLHVFELGPSRELADSAFTQLSKTAYNKGIFTKSVLVRSAYLRILELPIVKRFNIAPFRASSGEVHSRMTGTLRQKLLPFLSVALMGLQPGTHPDNDPLVQCALQLNHIQMKWRGINISSSNLSWTLEEINEFQDICKHACISLSNCLGLRISTKLHRLMWHMSDCISSFGCRRRGETDSNESLHKQSKSAYTATNKRITQLSAQILSVRNLSQSNNSPELINLYENLAHFPSEPVEIARDDQRRYDIPRITEIVSQHYKVVCENLEELLAGKYVEQILPVVTSIRIGPNQRRVWKEKKLMCFTARFTWLVDEEHTYTDLRTIVYTGEDILSFSQRRDTRTIREKRCQTHSSAAFQIKSISFILTLKFKLSFRTIQ